VASCPIFPSDDIWYTDISKLPVESTAPPGCAAWTRPRPTAPRLRPVRRLPVWHPVHRGHELASACGCLVHLRQREKARRHQGL